MNAISDSEKETKSVDFQKDSKEFSLRKEKTAVLVIFFVLMMKMVN